MQISGMVYEKPEVAIQEVIQNQQTIRTTRLAELMEPVTEKLK